MKLKIKDKWDQLPTSALVIFDKGFEGVAEANGSTLATRLLFITGLVRVEAEGSSDPCSYSESAPPAATEGRLRMDCLRFLLDCAFEYRLAVLKWEAGDSCSFNVCHTLSSSSSVAVCLLEVPRTLRRAAASLCPIL